jgi:hypothetical protein
MLGEYAERYFRDAPSTAIVKLRQFAELLAKLIATHCARQGLSWRTRAAGPEGRARKCSSGAHQGGPWGRTDQEAPHA